MDKFEKIKELGEGSYGCVSKAINKQTGEVVAVKKIKQQYSSWAECLNLREIKSLIKMQNHPNIVQLREIIYERSILFLVFECMEGGDLYEVMKERGNNLFSESEVRNLCFQVFHGLAYMHKQGYFHRDLKPENLFVTGSSVKIGDLGFAREINSKTAYTGYVMSRWYRAPEVLLRCHYSSMVDMWSMGAVMAELFTSRVLFPGTSEADQMYRICKIIGSPTTYSWADGLYQAGNIGYQFPECGGMNLSLLIPLASKDAIHLIKWLCSWDPYKRPTAAQALQHPFFQSSYSIPLTPCYRASEICEQVPISSIRYNKEHLQAVARQLLKDLQI